MTLPKTATPTRHPIAGLLIAAGLLCLIASFLPAITLTPLASYLLWAALLLLWPETPGRTRWQSGVLALIGVALLIAAASLYEEQIDWARSLTGNVQVLGMLIGVSFVGLIAGAQVAPDATRPPRTGWQAIVHTWLGVHVLSVVLNISTVFMVGDRLAREGKLQLPQLLVLNRSLSSAALWSPFFASMGIVLSLVPDMQYRQILLIGLPLALLAGLIATLDLHRRFDWTHIEGFSLSPRSLLMPVVMAVLVLLFYSVITPGLGIISIITFLMPLAALASLLPAGLRRTRRALGDHVRQRLPLMRGELSLFLAAGLLTLGLSTFIDAATGGEWRLFSQFGLFEAMISLLVICTTALIGLHPIIGISVLASMLTLEGQEQTLFALVALGSWAVGTSVGPLSGINLSLQGRYGTSGFLIMRHNLVYAATLLVLILAAMAIWYRVSNAAFG